MKNLFWLRKRWPIAALVLGCAALINVEAYAQKKHQAAFEPQNPEIRLPLMKHAPTIDGVIQPGEWASADRMQGFSRAGVSDLAPQQGGFWVGADAKNLYVAVQTQTPPGGKILKRANPMPNRQDTQGIVADDTIELWLSPRPDAPQANRKIFSSIFNAKGAIADQLHLGRGAKNWNGHWTVKNSVKKNHWDFEVALPWKDVGVSSPAGKTMAIRVVRNWRQSPAASQTEWGLGDKPFDAVSSMPRVTWDPAAPVVQLRQLQDAPDHTAHIRVLVSNPADQPRTLAVTARVVPENSAGTNYHKTVRLKPGQSQTLSVEPTARSHEILDTHLEVTSRDGQSRYYLRDFRWRLDRPRVVWGLNPEAHKRINVAFAYFPSYNAMHVKLDLSNLKDQGRVDGATLSIRKQGTTHVITQTTMPSSDSGITELNRWNIPNLKEGTYELITQLKGISKQPRIDTFVRHQFPWEGNQLGKSDVLVPPFTAIQVESDRISVIGRQHRLNDVGLWNQATAKGKPLLKKPMRIEAVIDGQTITATGKMHIADHSDTQATVRADWQAGGLKGTTKDVWDYDGVMKTVLTLNPPSATVSKLTLVIPLDGAMTPLMHAVTFGNKSNYAGAVPQGRGVIWKSAQAPGNKFIGTFVPYLWLGAQARGMAVFGDNDAGWITDDQSDSQELVRTADGTIELRLRLIQKPAKWDTPRRITLGFQTTPAKPMPKDWRLWTVSTSRTSQRASHADADVPGMYQQALLGNAVYWGGIAMSGDIYPGDGDMSIWKEFERLRKTGDTHGRNDQLFAQKWDKIALRQLSKTRPRRAKTVARGSRLGLVSMATQPQGVVIYTNARGARLDTPEGLTYVNEWQRLPFPQRDWPYAAGTNHGVDPVTSFRDCRVWYYQKAMSLFTDGIYWDATPLQPNFNPISSDAYRRPDARVQPSAGLWNERALIRRGAVLAHEMGKTNRNMVHMSGAEIVPIIDFSATRADWELKHGSGDFQDKFPRDFIQAETIGRQAGLVPFVILNKKFIVGNKQQAVWQYRTAAGVSLTHELKPWSLRGKWAKPDPFWANYDRLVTFGYGQPEDKVYNYWQNDYPAKISGETSSLLVSKPGATMLVLCSYDHGGTYTVKLNTNALSLNGSLRAVNVETKQPITVHGDTLTVNLKKHDFVVARIEAQNQ